MIYKEFCELTTGDKCVFIRTGEPGRVLSINRDRGDILLQANLYGMGMKKEWFHYTNLAKI